MFYVGGSTLPVSVDVVFCVGGSTLAVSADVVFYVREVLLYLYLQMLCFM